MSRRGAPRLLLAVLGVSLGGCGEEPRYLTLDVSAPEGGPPAFQLRVGLTLDGRTDLVLAPAEPARAPLSFPTDLSLELRAGSTGQLTVVVEALGEGGETVFDAQATGRVEDTTHLPVALIACAGRIAGPTSIGGSWGLFAPDRKFFNRVSLAEGGVVDHLSQYARGTGATGAQLVRGALYGEGPDQEPASLVATTEEIGFSGSAPAGWHDLVFSPPVVVGPGAYWIGIHAGGPDELMNDAYLVEPGTMRVAGDTYADGSDQVFSGATPADATMSIHLVYRGCL